MGKKLSCSGLLLVSWTPSYGASDGTGAHECNEGNFSREYKLEAVKLVRERGVSVAQAARDLNVYENFLRKWGREYGSDPARAFPGPGQMKPEQLEIERLRKEVAKLKAERDFLKNGPG